MKKIGLIGGMSWESTALYYQIVNREVSRRLGGLHSAPMHLISLDFADIAERQRAGDWHGMSSILSDAARNLENGGADCVLIGTNTMHKLAPEVQAAINVPLLHIADVTAKAILAKGLQKVGLLGTRFTMAHPFYRERLQSHGVTCLVPDDAAQAAVHFILFEELCKGKVNDNSRMILQKICADLGLDGAEGIVLGCTELPMILKAADIALPLFDTTTLHALAAVDFALEDVVACAVH
jgi:aspartate racemase